MLYVKLFDKITVGKYSSHSLTHSQGVARGYKGLQRVTRGYRGLQLVKGATKCYRGFEEVNKVVNQFPKQHAWRTIPHSNITNEHLNAVRC